VSQELFDVLKRRCGPAELRKQLGTSARDLDAHVLQLTASLNGTASLYDGQGDSPEGQAVFAYVRARCHECGVEAERASRPLDYTPELVELREWVRRRYFPDSPPVTPELLEWARSTFNKEDYLAGLREFEATGGVGIQDLLDEWEQEAASRE
jgi:hypothetical protein